ncbi:MAG: hypothetical protein JSW34_10975 [Candidatus Zixiibacteriota bacterium]|nr:MAG: hypothetical protein JSW34_10975 [candidate division Zixibacteria bacterium]
MKGKPKHQGVNSVIESKSPRLWCLLALIFVAILAPSLLAVDARIGQGRQLLRQGQLEPALELFSAIIDEAGGDVQCLAEAHLYRGVCLDGLGRTGEVKEEFREAIRLMPKLRFPADEDLSAELHEKYQRTRRELLCTVEVSVATSEAIAMLQNEELRLSYRLEDVLAGQLITLESNRHTPYAQAHKLIPGRVNAFVLVWATGTADTAVAIHLAQPRKTDVYSHGAARQDATGCYLEVNGQRLDIDRKYYAEVPLTRLVIGEEPAVMALEIIEANPEWRRLQRDLRRNPAVRSWVRGLKIASAVGFVAAGTTSLYWNKRAGDQFDVYMDALPAETHAAYDEYEHRVALRNIFGGFALSFAVLESLWFLTAPRSQSELLKDFESKKVRANLALDAGSDYVGLKLAVSF